jgi:hypothetical protein
MLGTGGHYGAAGRKAAGMYESLRDLRGPAGFFVVSSYRHMIHLWAVVSA